MRWFSRIVFACQFFSAMSKMPRDVCLTCVEMDHLGRWVARGYHRSTGTPVYDYHSSPYIAISRMVRAAEAESNGIDWRSIHHDVNRGK